MGRTCCTPARRGVANPLHALCGGLRDAIDHHTEQQDHQAGHQTLALQLGFRAAEDHEIAEPARTDEAADDDISADSFLT